MSDPSRKTLLIVYQSTTGATRQMAEAVARGATDEGGCMCAF
jgi:flavodoxin